MTIAHRFIGGCQGRGFNESVKRTTDDKPNANQLFSRPLHGLDHIRVLKPSAKALGYIGGCQGRGFNEAVKRTTDDKPNANELFSRPLHGLDHIRVSKPSAKALGYFRSVRFADEDQLLLQQSLLTPTPGTDSCPCSRAGF